MSCKQRGLQVKIGTFPFAANARARGMGEIEGQVKVIADAATTHTGEVSQALLAQGFARAYSGGRRPGLVRFVTR